MSASLSRYLKDFSAPKIELTRMPPPPKYFADIDVDLTDADRAVKPAMPEIDVEAERRRAFAEGRAEAGAELAFEHQREIAELKARHAEELEALTRRLEEEVARKLAEGFGAMTERLALAIGDQAARVLAPVLDEALRREAIENLAAMLRQGLAEGEGLAITVRGPLALFEALQAQLPETTVFRHVESGDVDLTVEMGETILVTRLAAWSDTVRKVLA